LGLAAVFSLYLAIMGIMGLTMPLYNTPTMVLLQTKVEPTYMGRVLAVFNMISSIMMPTGMFLFGLLAGVVAIDFILIITGVVIVLLSIPVSKTLRKAGKTPA
jgi:DHA3 family macrolide efflux protein-like MFS transporter